MANFEEDDVQKEIPKTGSKTPFIDNFGKDLTKMAEDGLLDPVIGRENELNRIAQILSRRKKNNPVLLGEPGCGKSAIASGLAIKIYEKKVPRSLIGKRIIEMDMASMVAGTKFRGQFEERVKELIKEIESNPGIILFIDEIHTMVGAGSTTGSMDASNMFKPSLARGTVQCIGATTIDEYRKFVEKDGALERRFQKVMIGATSKDETVHILNNIKDRYEDHHLVRYTDEAIKACVTLTNRYISGRCLPDKAIDAMDEAGAKVHIGNVNVPPKITKLEAKMDKIKQSKKKCVESQKFEEAAEYRDEERKLIIELEEAKKEWLEKSQKNRQTVTEEHIAEVVAMMTGIPVTRISQNESIKLLTMKADLQKEVIGQDDAIDKMVKCIQRNRAGLKDPKRPIGSFIFLGTSGVGKTHLAKMLSKYLFDSEDNLIRVDMSEYMEKFNVSRMVGAAPGYVGYDKGGDLTEKVRNKPYSIVLFDEIEKAHPDVFQILLQILDEGRLTDSSGRLIDFKNTVIIMTSNIGTRQVKEFGSGVGFSTKAKTDAKDEYAKATIDNQLKKTFAPEFLNRIDDIIVFNNLEREDIHKIIDIELVTLNKRLQEMGYKMEITEAAKDFVMEKGWDPDYGARPLKRAIQKYVEDELSTKIIDGSLKKEFVVDKEPDGDKIVVK